MKSLRNALILCAACVSTQAHGTNFFVAVDPVTGQHTIAIAAGQLQTPPSANVADQRLGALEDMGYFSDAGRQSHLTPQQIASIIGDNLGTTGAPGFEDMDTESWTGNPDFLAALRNVSSEAAGAASSQMTDAMLRALLGLASSAEAEDESTASDTPRNVAQTREQLDAKLRDLINEQEAQRAAQQRQNTEALARQRLETLQREREAAELARRQAELQAAQRANLLSEALRQQAEASQRARLEAEAARRHAAQIERVAQLVDDRENDFFADFPYYSAGERFAYDPDAGVRAGQYSGIARGKDFGGNDITGTVDLDLNLDEDPTFSGQFNFGSVGTLNVFGYYGNPDYVAEYFALHLDAESFFDGVELDSHDASFDGTAHFFGPNGQEIGGDWSIHYQDQEAGGEFAAARTTP